MAVKTEHTQEVVPSRTISWGMALTVLVGIAFALRLFYLNQIAALPLLDQPIGDSAIYLKRANEIASGSWLPARPFFYGSMLYPYYLAAVLTLSHDKVYWVCISQIIAGGVLVWVLASTARRIYGSTAGLVAGAVTALYGPFAFLEADVLGVVWGLLALGLAVFVSIAWARGESSRYRSSSWLWMIGLCCGLAATERPNLVVLVPIVVGWCVMQTPRGRARTVVRLLAGAALPIVLVIGINVAATGQWVPLTTSSGINLSIGYHAGATGTYEEPWEKESSQFAAEHTDLEEASVTMASAQTGQALAPQEASAYWMARARTFIMEHPATAAQLTLRKAGLMLNGVEIPNHLDYSFIRDQAPALWLMPIGFSAIFPLAVLGAGASLYRRTGRDTALLIALAGGAMLSVLPFFVADRYRAPMVLPMIILAGAGGAELLRLARNRDKQAVGAVGIPLICALLAAAVTMLPLARPLKGRDYWIFAQAYQAKGNVQAAVRAYELAVREEGHDAALLTNLALAYKAVGRREQAAATLRQAIHEDSTLALPHKNLGMLLISAGDLDGAAVELRSAARLAPRDAQTLAAIGAISAEKGHTAAAALAFTQALELSPEDPQIVGLLQHYPLVKAAIRPRPANALP